jgi:dUTP pyrophosphatase
MFELDTRILVQVLDGGKLPSKAHHNDAGFDVYATSDFSVAPGEVVKHPLNIKLLLPHNTWARVETKSGLGSRGMLVYSGVIDEGYRGIVHAILTNLNHKDGPIEIKKGQKLAQITMNNHSTQYEMIEVPEIEANTSRASGGFGSSGIY